jgi:hypothetical protein
MLQRQLLNIEAGDRQFIGQYVFHLHHVKESVGEGFEDGVRNDRAVSEDTRLGRPGLDSSMNK